MPSVISDSENYPHSEFFPYRKKSKNMKNNALNSDGKAGNNQPKRGEEMNNLPAFRKSSLKKSQFKEPIPHLRLNSEVDSYEFQKSGHLGKLTELQSTRGSKNQNPNNRSSSVFTRQHIVSPMSRESIVRSKEGKFRQSTGQLDSGRRAT